MPRWEKHYAERELDVWRRDVELPQYLVVQSQIMGVVRNDTGRECPVTGSDMVRSIGIEDDLLFVIDTKRRGRQNAWDPVSSGAREAFDNIVDMAVEWGTPGVSAVKVPVRFECQEELIPMLLDDETETLYWSGGWRSTKTFRGGQWWVRGWMKYGGRGELFWLMGPERIHPFRIMQKIFLGKSSVPPILPVDERGRPILAYGLPEKATQLDQTFNFPDGAVCEMHHARHVSQLEGESVNRILYDEASRQTKSDAYDIACGRVMQSMGQVGVTCVPDEDAEWIYEKIVSPFEQGKNVDGTVSNKRVVYLSGLDNPWMRKEAVERRASAETDPIVRAMKVHGKWDRRGLYAYAGCFKEATHTKDLISIKPEAWGFEKDITREVTRRKCKRTADWLIGVDFNQDPQTQVMFKIFGDIDDWLTWTMVALDEATIKGDPDEAAKQLARRRDGRYKGAVVVCDAHGFSDAHKYGGKANRSYDAFYYKKRGFYPMAPILTHHNDGRKPSPSNPQVQQSRTVVRNLFRRTKMLANESTAPQVINAWNKAPNRRKRNADKRTWIERTIYNLEDCTRYPVWKVFGRLVEKLEDKAIKEAEKMAQEHRAQ